VLYGVVYEAVVYKVYVLTFRTFIIWVHITHDIVKILFVKMCKFFECFFKMINNLNTLKITNIRTKPRFFSNAMAMVAF